MEAEIDFITPEEFAKHMKVSRSTVFSWMKSGSLKAGVHYLRIGRTLRFQWGPELVKALNENSVREEVEKSRPPARQRIGPRPTGNKGRVPSANLDF